MLTKKDSRSNSLSGTRQSEDSPSGGSPAAAAAIAATLAGLSKDHGSTAKAAYYLFLREAVQPTAYCNLKHIP